MKKALVILLAIASCITLASCGSSSSSATNNDVQMSEMQKKIDNLEKQLSENSITTAPPTSETAPEVSNEIDADETELSEEKTTTAQKKVKTTTTSKHYFEITTTTKFNSKFMIYKDRDKGNIKECRNWIVDEKGTTNVMHLLGCPRMMNAKNIAWLNIHGDYDEMLADGYTPCPECCK